MRRQIHWAFLLLGMLALVIESLAWGGAVNLAGAGAAIRRSIGTEAPIATLYSTIGEALRGVPSMREYSDSFAADAFSVLDDRIIAQPMLATELAFGETTTPRHGRLKWLYYAPWILFAIAGALFATRPPKVHLVPKRR